MVGVVEERRYTIDILHQMLPPAVRRIEQHVIAAPRVHVHVAQSRTRHAVEERALEPQEPRCDGWDRIHVIVVMVGHQGEVVRRKRTPISYDDDDDDDDDDCDPVQITVGACTSRPTNR